MLFYKVLCYEAGIWDKKEPCTTEAQNEQAAAEHVCGGPLEEGVPNLGHLRAKIWPESNPTAIKWFSVSARSISNRYTT